MLYLTTRKNLKLQLSPGLVASYDIQPGNGVSLFWDTHTPDPHGDRNDSSNDLSACISCYITLEKVAISAALPLEVARPASRSQL